MMTGKLTDLRIIGGHPALDLANTVAPRPPGAVETEFLHSPAALVEWALRVGVISAGEASRIAAEAPEAGLTEVLALRGLVDEVLAGRQLGALTRRWAEAIGRSQLVTVDAGDSVIDDRVRTRSAVLMIGLEPDTMIADRLADALVDLLRHAELSRLRTCPLAEGGCGWLFLDRSRNLSRRWCSMDDCGTHAKSRRLTERRRAKADFQ